MVDQIKKLISDCDSALSQMRRIPPTAPWIIAGGPSFEGVFKEISGLLEDLVDSAARMDVPDSPPAPPVLFGIHMSTKRGIPVAIGYIKDLRRWSESLLPKVNPSRAPDITNEIETKAKGEPAKPGALLGASLDEQALIVFVSRNGNITKKEIARILVESGVRETCHEKSLAPGRCPRLDMAIRAYRAAHRPPQGSKDRDGNVEAYEDE